MTAATQPGLDRVVYTSYIWWHLCPAKAWQVHAYVTRFQVKRVTRTRQRLYARAQRPRYPVMKHMPQHAPCPEQQACEASAPIALQSKCCHEVCTVRFDVGQYAWLAHARSRVSSTSQKTWQQNQHWQNHSDSLPVNICLAVHVTMGCLSTCLAKQRCLTYSTRSSASSRCPP
jgi:hypothetical protein